MSHFTVLVVGDDPEGQLAPFHEFECTGVNDEYVQDIDITEDAKKEYDKATTAQLVAPDGTVYDRYDDRFYRDMTEEEKRIVGPLGGCGSCSIGSYISKDWKDGKGYRAKLHFVPEGYVEQTVPKNSIQSFAEFIDYYYGYKPVSIAGDPDLQDVHKYGYYLTDVAGNVLKVVDRTNPNKKWDWYVLGGRWGEFFTAKDGRKVNQARKGGIDFDAMFSESAKEAGELWDKVHAIVAGRPIPNWNRIRESHKDGIEAARSEYNAYPVVDDLAAQLHIYGDVSRYDCPRDQFCEQCAKSSIRTFAVVRDGKWYEQGQMGWWGVVIDEKDDDVWNQEYDRLIADLPDNVLLSVYDCHI